MIRKMTIVSAVLFLPVFMAVSCSGIGGDKISDANSKGIVLQSLQAAHNAICSEFSSAMYEKNYPLDTTGSVLNLKYSTSCGLTVSEKIAYEADLEKWEISAGIYPSENKTAVTDLKICKIVISGNMKGYVEVKKWASSADRSEIDKTGFSHRDSDGLQLTVIETLTEKVLWSGTVFPAADISATGGTTGGNFETEFKVNGDDYEGNSEIWENFWKSFVKVF